MSLVSVTDLASVLSSASSGSEGGGVEVDFDGTVLVMAGLLLVLWLVLKPLIFDPMLRLFEERERRIDGAKLLARKIDEKSAGALADYEKEMQQARTTANAERDKIRAEGTKREAEILARVRAETAKTLEEGRQQMKGETSRRRARRARDRDAVDRHGVRLPRARARGARMKRAHAFVLAAALVAAAPALAHAVQPERRPPAPRQRAPPRTQATEHAERRRRKPRSTSTRPKPINWFDFSNKEQPPYGVMLINFGILMIMYYSLGKKPIAEALKNRRASVSKEIEEAQKMRAEAEARALKYQQKLRDLEGELIETRSALKAAGEAERDRIVREAEEKAGRMERDAKFLVEQELKQMRAELTREAVEMAVAAAEEMLRKRITPADQERLAEDYLSQLGAKRPSGSQEARPDAAPGGE